MAEKEIKYDVDGEEAITSALRELINEYPALSEDDEIQFATLGADNGKAMFPVSGAVISTERESVTGHVTQTCVYPFYVVYRASGLSENRKAAVKEWLDNLGKWLERQEVTINKEPQKLARYPTLSGDREFTSIDRQTPAYLDGTNENKSEDWAIYISAHYRNEYDL